MAPEERRASILDAAQRAFARHGDVAGTTIREIAHEANISEGIIYRYFESKEELFYEAAVRPLHAALATGIDKMRQLVPELPGADRHRLAVEYHREMIQMLADVIPLLGLVLFGDPAYAGAFYREVLVPSLDELDQQWRAAYQRISNEEELPNRYGVLAHFGIALMFALDQVRAENPPSIDALARSLTDAGYSLVVRPEDYEPAADR